MVSLGKKFTAAVKRNVFLALAFNVIGIPIAALGYLNPFTAMLIMIADVSAVFASTRLLRKPRSPSQNDTETLEERSDLNSSAAHEGIIIKKERN